MVAARGPCSVHATAHLDAAYLREGGPLAAAAGTAARRVPREYPPAERVPASTVGGAGLPRASGRTGRHRKPLSEPVCGARRLLSPGATGRPMVGVRGCGVTQFFG